MLSATPSLISVNFAGTGGGNGPSDEASVTSDGRFIAFSSFATDLVPNDTNKVEAIYLRDSQTNTTTLVSVGANGAAADGNSTSPKVSDDGRFVVFVSTADNLVANDTNKAADIFIRDLQTGTTTRVSTALNGGNASGFSGEPVISADGMYVAYSSTANNLVLSPVISNGHDNVFLWNRVSGQTKLISVNGAGNNGGNGSSFDPSLSAGGNNVTFRSNATDLGGAIPTTGDFNVYLRNLTTNTTSLVSVNAAGNAGGDKDSTTPRSTATAHWSSSAAAPTTWSPTTRTTTTTSSCGTPPTTPPPCSAPMTTAPAPPTGSASSRPSATTGTTPPSAAPPRT